jgi:hypothetical protein
MMTRAIAGQLETATADRFGEFAAAGKYAHLRITRIIHADVDDTPGCE